ncbi:iron-regulated protein [Puteibacter caeruleilacunae]|nr:iron-regulated protein [Puteibacter caeruleilacunae]
MKNLSRLIMILLVIVSSSCSNAQRNYSSDNPAYVIYDKNGNKVSYETMIKDICKADVCLFGELHNNPISHWLELNVVDDLYKVKDSSLVMGAEMWEADGQGVLDEFLKDNFIDENTYLRSARLWSNVSTDYMPLIKFAAENKIKFVCSNVPRRYASMVSDRGDACLDSLSAAAKRYLPELPVHFNMKEKIYEKLAEGFKHVQDTPMKGSDMTNFIKAQALKDATMAHFINKNMEQGDYFFHFHGDLHSAFYSGIGYYLKHYNPTLRVKTISTVLVKDVLKFDKKNSRADFNIVVPNNMTSTYVE